jgi:hypothetical protein
MAKMATPESVLKEIAQIQRMERGKLCRIRTGPSGPYYNHQTWENGRNVVRYVPREEVAALQAAIEGYQRYTKLTQTYADLIIAQTRPQQSSHSKPARPAKMAAKKSKPGSQPKPMTPNEQKTP